MGAASSNKAAGESYKHPVFGDVRLFKKVGCDYSMEVELSCSKGMFDEWVKCLPTVSYNSEAIYYPQEWSFQELGPCGMLGRARVASQLIPYSLEHEFRKRAFEENYFTEQELWYIVFTMCEAHVFNEKVNQRSSSFHPRSVLLSAEGQARVITRGSLPIFVQPLAQFRQGKQIPFLSPQQLQALRTRNFHPDINYALAESFSIGATLLGLATLRDCQILYDQQSMKLRENRVKQLQTTLGQGRRYSQFFCRVVQSLLELRVEARHSPGEIWAVLLGYEDNIINLEPFVAKPQPQSVQQYHERVSKYPHFSGYLKSRERRPLL